MGWDSVAVSTAANGHAQREAKEAQAAEEERENERTESHAAYLRTLKRKDKTYSPVGSYLVDFKEIDNQWPRPGYDLSLDIRQTDVPGVFEASFDFRVLEGAMIISADAKALERYVPLSAGSRGCVQLGLGLGRR